MGRIEEINSNKDNNNNNRSEVDELPIPQGQDSQYGYPGYTQQQQQPYSPYGFSNQPQPNVYSPPLSPPGATQYVYATTIPSPPQPQQQQYYPPQQTYYTQQSPPPVIITTSYTTNAPFRASSTPSPADDELGRTQARAAIILFILGFFFYITWCVNIGFLRSRNATARSFAIASLVLSIIYLVAIVAIIPIVVITINRRNSSYYNNNF